MRMILSRLLLAVTLITAVFSSSAATAQDPIALQARSLATQAKARADTARSTARLNAPAPAAFGVGFLDQAPLAPPPAWAASTAYATGDVVAANGSWYIAMSAGTSASSGSGPSQRYPAGVPSDGNILWAFLSDAMITTPDALNPTVTLEAISPFTTANPTGLTNRYRPLIDTSSFSLLGASGLEESGGGGYSRLTGWQTGTGTLLASGAYAFETEASEIAFGAISGARYRVMIDGRWRTIGPEVIGAGQVTRFAFPGGRKKRSIIIETGVQGGQSSFFAVWVPYFESIRPLAKGAPLLFVTDSWGLQAGLGFQYGSAMPQMVGRALGFTETIDAAIGGRGYVQRPAAGVFTFRETLAQYANLPVPPPLTITSGSINDVGVDAATLRAEVAAYCRTLRALFPAALHVIVGAQPVNRSTIANHDAILQAAVAEVGDPRIVFVSPIGAAGGPWISGSWNNAARPGYTNSGWMISNDGSHSYDIGYTIYARRIADAVRSIAIR